MKVKDIKLESINLLFQEVLRRLNKIEKRIEDLEKKTDGFIEEKRTASEKIEKSNLEESNKVIQKLLKNLSSF